MREGFGGGGLHGGGQSIGQQKENNFGGFFTASVYHFMHLVTDLVPLKLVNWHHAVVEFLNFIIS